MQLNKWTIALATVGAVSFAAQAEEHPISSALTGTTLSGYVDTAAIWNFGTGSQQATRAANTSSSRQDGFNLNAVKLALEKPLDEGTWSAGYKVETILGPDATDLPGLVASQVALKQAYVAVRAPIGNGLDVKVGQYDPIVGYEVFDSYANPNFSRSFGYALEPLGHTGVLASYQFSEVFGASAGVANSGGLAGNSLVAGHNTAESVKNYMLGIVAKAPQGSGWLEGSSLYAGVIDGANKVSKDGVLVYVGGTIATPWKELTVGASYDTLLNAGAGDGYANAFAVYVSYQITEKLKLNNRFEYANSGGIVGGVFNVADKHGDEKVFGITSTADYSLWANVVTRLEFRWDHAANGSTIGSGAHAQVNDLSVVANVIYKF